MDYEKAKKALATLQREQQDRLQLALLNKIELNKRSISLKIR